MPRDRPNQQNTAIQKNGGTHMDLEHEKRLTEVEQRAKSNSHRIGKLEGITEEIHELNKTMVLLCERMKTTSDNVEELSQKMDEIEKEPSEIQKSFKKEFVKALATSLGSAVFAGIIYFIASGGF